MINVTISYNFQEENRSQLENLPVSIQLALYKYDIYKNNKEYILKNLEGSLKIKVVHLPLDTMHIDYEKIDELVEDIFIRTGCVNFVVHPNKGIEKFIKYFHKKSPQLLCIETFAWRRNKVFRSPLEIINACQIYRGNLWMTIDTCHIEDIWFDHRIMPYLLKFTKVIHLSNRAKGIGSHLPFNHPKGELNLVGFVRDLKYRYNWSGTIVLEYMEEYSAKLIKNHSYIKKLLGEN